MLLSLIFRRPIQSPTIMSRSFQHSLVKKIVKKCSSINKVFLQNVVTLLDSRAVKFYFSRQVDGKIWCLFLLFVLKKCCNTSDNFIQHSTDQVKFKVIFTENSDKYL